jgi:hypothetical protein
VLKDNVTWAARNYYDFKSGSCGRLRNVAHEPIKKADEEVETLLGL